MFGWWETISARLGWRKSSKALPSWRNRHAGPRRVNFDRQIHCRQRLPDMTTGVLLINLGTPDAPTPDAVGRYLREFLMDPFVIDLPAPLRWFFVNVLIVPRRKYQSAEAYQKIQTPEGSPLLVHTRALAHEVARQLNQPDNSYLVEFGMRYGNPSIKSALKNLSARGASRIIVVPLYPQYAESSYETAMVATKRNARELGCEGLLTFLPPFY